MVNANKGVADFAEISVAFCDVEGRRHRVWVVVPAGAVAIVLWLDEDVAAAVFVVPAVSAAVFLEKGFLVVGCNLSNVSFGEVVAMCRLSVDLNVILAPP